MRNNKRIYLLLLLFLAAVAGLLLADPIPQDLEYHNFADKRSFWGIPNFWDVMSNLPMFFLGLYGIWISFKNWSLRPDLVAQWLPLILSIGIFTASFGSAYYHWAPDNATLVWDRLPMTFMFMPLFALLLYDFIGKKVGRIAFFVLIPLGVFSVFYWQYTESIGQVDLRFYAFVQFFPIVVIPFLLWLFPKKVPYVRYILLVVGWYILAKICEHFDKEIYDLLTFWSGHTLKHLVASISLFYILKLVVAWERELIRGG